jgi:hypothetical protein
MTDIKRYSIEVHVDRTHHVVTVISRAAHLPEMRLAFQAAWGDDDDAGPPSDADMTGRQAYRRDIVTYDDYDEAVTEAMTDLREHFDDDTRYRPDWLSYSLDGPTTTVRRPT